MEKDAHDPFCPIQLYHMVSSGNPASSILEHAAKSVLLFGYHHASGCICRCSADDGLYFSCAEHGVPNILQGFINPNTAPLFLSSASLRLSRFLVEFGVQTMHLK